MLRRLSLLLSWKSGNITGSIALFRPPLTRQAVSDWHEHDSLVLLMESSVFLACLYKLCKLEHSCICIATMEGGVQTASHVQTHIFMLLHNSTFSFMYDQSETFRKKYIYSHLSLSSPHLSPISFGTSSDANLGGFCLYMASSVLGSTDVYGGM